MRGSPDMVSAPAGADKWTAPTTEKKIDWVKQAKIAEEEQKAKINQDLKGAFGKGIEPDYSESKKFAEDLKGPAAIAAFNAEKGKPKPPTEFDRFAADLEEARGKAAEEAGKGLPAAETKKNVA